MKSVLNVLILGANGQLARNTTRVFREWSAVTAWA